MDFRTEIKKLVIGKGLTLTFLAKKIEEKRGRKYSLQNFSTKLKNGTVTLREFSIILDTLGYSIEFKEK